MTCSFSYSATEQTASLSLTHLCASPAPAADADPTVRSRGPPAMLLHVLLCVATSLPLSVRILVHDTRYRAALPAEFCAKKPPPMYITLYYVVAPALPDSIRVVRGPNFLSRVLSFPLLPSVASAAAADLLGLESVGAALPLVGDVALARARGARARAELEGAVAVAAEAAEGVGVAAGVVVVVVVVVAAAAETVVVVAPVVVEAAAGVEAVEVEAVEVEAVEAAAAEAVVVEEVELVVVVPSRRSGGGGGQRSQRHQQQRSRDIPPPQQLRHPSLARLRSMALVSLSLVFPVSPSSSPPGPGPSCAPVRGQGYERYFLLVVDDYSRYTTVLPLRSKGSTFTRGSLGLRCPQPCWWTGKVGDASVFRVWGSRAFVRDLSADKLSPRAAPCVFLGFPTDAPGWQFLPPLLSSCSVLPGRHTPFPLRFLLPQVLSQVDAVDPVEVTGDSGAAAGAEPGGADSLGVLSAGVLSLEPPRSLSLHRSCASGSLVVGGVLLSLGVLLELELELLRLTRVCWCCRSRSCWAAGPLGAGAAEGVGAETAAVGPAAGELVALVLSLRVLELSLLRLELLSGLDRTSFRYCSRFLVFLLR
ncbi:unnamed protein product [Closterium sp. NIES-64]|nr:unnamed protein product [Closterium sp. NIES-64]